MITADERRHNTIMIFRFIGVHRRSSAAKDF
jgi:hypothetical protein